MGWGGRIVLVNGTPYTWERTDLKSHQMEAWTFPVSIAPKSSSTIYLEWDEGILLNESKDTGDVTYQLAGTSSSFQVLGRSDGHHKYHLQIYLSGMETQNHPRGYVFDLGFIHNGDVNFILSGKEGNFCSINPPIDWMHSFLPTLGSRTLREICIPGSHDAGMSTRSGGTAFAVKDNVITQTGPVSFQLQAGSRYFDLRPAISAGHYVAGHYSYVDPLKSWQGGNGQSFDDVISQINDFTSRNRELVIVDLSHDLNTDVGNSSYRALTQDEWNTLLDKFKNQLQHLYVAPDPVNIDLSTLRLGDIISTQPAVIVIVRADNRSVNIDAYNSSGFYRSSQLNIYNSYSNSPDLDTMSTDQYKKMAAQRTSPDSGLFLLSWTLTQDAADAIGSVVSVKHSILDLAKIANPAIYKSLLAQCTSNCFPNVLYIDGMDSSDITALAMAVNNSTVIG
ncbi:PLC-like phosphodiesterase [Pluteus cervinus]|uniref:PLC-like phosphodiesterase n=1 Tax=Pluteus cervinus TaxID=181527 RepID=A0ACD3B5I5_9AGAR|nr:PLC-like phosphodiesterase [Pluteus cervinus]